MTENSCVRIVHVIYRLDVGGLENGLVNLINRLHQEKYKHIVICIDDYTDFNQRIKRDDVEFYALKKRDGKDPGVYWQMFKLLRKIRPQIVHTRNLPALDMVFIAFLARVPIRIHSEHGRDVIDIDGKNLKYQRLRRILSPLIRQFVALSKDLEQWLVDEVRIPAPKVLRICNGVDTERFYPAAKDERCVAFPFKEDAIFVIGSVIRMQTVKNPLLLVRAFIKLVTDSLGYDHVRLVMIGDGELFDQAIKEIKEAGLDSRCWLPGARDDVPELIRHFDVFVLPSLAEGISNTILEAMASGLPVIATDVGGNRELIDVGKTGTVVPSEHVDALVEALAECIENPEQSQAEAQQARQRAVEQFSIETMVEQYDRLYGGYC